MVKIYTYICLASYQDQPKGKINKDLYLDVAFYFLILLLGQTVIYTNSKYSNLIVL